MSKKLIAIVLSIALVASLFSMVIVSNADEEVTPETLAKGFVRFQAVRSALSYLLVTDEELGNAPIRAYYVNDDEISQAGGSLIEAYRAYEDRTGASTNIAKARILYSFYKIATAENPVDVLVEAYEHTGSQNKYWYEGHETAAESANITIEGYTFGTESVTVKTGDQRVYDIDWNALADEVIRRVEDLKPKCLDSIAAAELVKKANFIATYGAAQGAAGQFILNTIVELVPELIAALPFNYTYTELAPASDEEATPLEIGAGQFALHYEDEKGKQLFYVENEAETIMIPATSHPDQAIVDELADKIAQLQEAVDAFEDLINDGVRDELGTKLASVVQFSQYKPDGDETKEGLWSTYKDAYEAACAAYYNVDATKDDCDQALTALTNAYAGINNTKSRSVSRMTEYPHDGVPEIKAYIGDYREDEDLNDLIEEADSNFDELMHTLPFYTTVMNDTEMNEIRAHNEELVNAIGNYMSPEAVANEAAATYAQIFSEQNGVEPIYTEESYDAFMAAWEEFRAEYKAGFETIAETVAAYDAFMDAVDALEEIPEPTEEPEPTEPALSEELVAVAEETLTKGTECYTEVKDSEEFTEESKQAVNSAVQQLSNALEAYQSGEGSETDVIEAIVAVETAIVSLEGVTAEEPVVEPPTFDD